MDTEMTSVDANAIAQLVLKHATDGNWRALAALGIVVVVFAIRKGALHPAALGRFKQLAWFKTDKGGVALNFLVSTLGGLGNALAAKLPFTKELLLTSVVNACIAAGVFVSIKRLVGIPATPALPAAPVVPAAPAAPVEPAVVVAPAAPADDTSAITTTTTTSTEITK